MDITKQLADLEAKLKAEANEEAKKTIQAEIDKLKGEYISKADVTVMLDERDKAKQKEIDEMSAQIKLFKEQGLAAGNKSFKNIVERIDEALQGKSVKIVEEEKSLRIEHTNQTVLDVLKEIKSEKYPRMRDVMSIKAATDLVTIAGAYTGGVQGLTNMMGGVNLIPQYKPYLRNIVNVMPTSKTYVSWVEELSWDEPSDYGVAEGSEKPQASGKVIERSEKVKKRAVWAEASKESLDDIPFMNAYIRTRIIDGLARDLNSQLATGDGTGNNLKGLEYFAPAFNITGTALLNSVINANEYDVLRAAAASIQVNSKDTFIPNYFVIHPYKAAAMDMTKADDGVYVMPPFTTADGRRIAGMIGIENSLQGEDDFYVGDFTKLNLALREDINISVGLKGNDFIENIVTILGEYRALAFVMGNDKKAFLQGDFSFAKGQLDPSATSA